MQQIGAGLLDIYQAASTGDIYQTAGEVEAFRQEQVKKFFQSNLIAPLMLYYAWRGKIDPIARTFLFVMGTAAILKKFQDVKSQPFVQKLLAPQALPIPMVNEEGVMFDNTDEFSGGMS